MDPSNYFEALNYFQRHRKSSSYFASNIKWIQVNKLTSYPPPPEIIMKPLIFRWFQGE